MRCEWCGLTVRNNFYYTIDVYHFLLMCREEAFSKQTQLLEIENCDEFLSNQVKV
jgi:hypothetical protein